MPQLDIVTFFSQFFWLSLFFIGFYYLLYKYFLPSYSRSILFRDKFTSSSLEGSSLYSEEKENIASSLSLCTISAISFSKKDSQIHEKIQETGTKILIKTQILLHGKKQICYIWKLLEQNKQQKVYLAIVFLIW